MDNTKVIVGLKYEVKANDSLGTYTDYKYIKMDSCKNPSFYYSVHGFKSKEDNTGVDLYVGTYDKCKNFISLFFEIIPNEYLLRNALEDDAIFLKRKDESVYHDIADRILNSLDYLIPVHCNDSIENILEEYYKERSKNNGEGLKKLKKSYVNLMKLQFKVKFGDAMLTSDFLKMVEDGSIIDYDGSGDYYTKNLEEACSISVNPESVKSMAEHYPYVVWYNR